MEPKKYMGISRKKKKNERTHKQTDSEIMEALNADREVVHQQTESEEMADTSRSIDSLNQNRPKTTVAAVPRTPAKASTPEVKAEARPVSNSQEMGIMGADGKPYPVKRTADGSGVTLKDPSQQDNITLKKKKGLSESFKKAIGHLAPSAIGMLVGGLMEGSEGAVEGYDRGMQLTKGLHDLVQQDQKMEVSQQQADTQRMFAENARMKQSQSDKSKQRLSTNWVDVDNNPVLEKDGIPVDDNGTPIPTSELKRYSKPITPLEEARINQLNASTRSRSIEDGVSKKTLTPGELKADQEFSKDYQKWATGGFSNVQSNLSKLKAVLADIKDPNTERGSVILPESVRARTNPGSVTAEQQVGNVIFQSLKEILGGQFTEKEGQKLVQQTYDPRLSDEDNAVKLEAAIKQLEDMALAKQASSQYFGEKGTLKGFKGTSQNQIGNKPQVDVQSMEERKQRLSSKLFTR